VFGRGIVGGQRERAEDEGEHDDERWVTDHDESPDSWARRPYHN
jgi:hypothetical protein